VWMPFSSWCLASGNSQSDFLGRRSLLETKGQAVQCCCRSFGGAEAIVFPCRGSHLDRTFSKCWLTACRTLMDITTPSRSSHASPSHLWPLHWLQHAWTLQAPKKNCLQFVVGYSADSFKVPLFSFARELLETPTLAKLWQWSGVSCWQSSSICWLPGKAEQEDEAETCFSWPCQAALGFDHTHVCQGNHW